MATRSREVQYEIAGMKRNHVPDSVIEQVMRERRNQVEAEIFRFSTSGRRIDVLKMQIKHEREKMSALGSPEVSDMPKGPHNPQACENRMVNAIAKIEAWEETIRMEEEKNEGFVYAFGLLPEDSQTVIKYTYGLFGAEKLTIEGLAEKMGYSRSHTSFARTDAMNLLALHLLEPVSVTHPYI